MNGNEIVNMDSSVYRYQFLPRPLLSSNGLGWRGLVVERYQMPPCELQDLPITHHIVECASQQHVSLGERPDSKGQLRPYSKYPGTCSFFPGGIRPKLRSFTETNLIVCGLDPDFVEDVSEELSLNPVAQLREATSCGRSRVRRAPQSPAEPSLGCWRISTFAACWRAGCRATISRCGFSLLSLRCCWLGRRWPVF